MPKKIRKKVRKTGIHVTVPRPQPSHCRKCDTPMTDVWVSRPSHQSCLKCHPPEVSTENRPGWGSWWFEACCAVCETHVRLPSINPTTMVNAPASQNGWCTIDGAWYCPTCQVVQNPPKR